MAIWIVRGGSRWDDAEQDFLDSESVGIYFGADQSISRMSHANLRLEIEQFYICDLKKRHETVEQSRVQGVVTYYLNQLLKFRDDIELGDTIIMPRKRSGGHRVARGVITEEYQYWHGRNYPHRRRVRWMGRKIPRDVIGQTWALSDRRTVFRVDDT